MEYKERARALVHERLRFFREVCGVKYSRVAIRDQRSRWGSCSIGGNLNFNYRIVFLPAHLVDYIIVHELCHLKHPHHGAEFWTMVEQYIPDAIQRRGELREWEKRLLRDGPPVLGTPIG